MLPHSLLFFYIYGSCSLSVIHQLHILEALNILLKLGKSVIPYLKIPELHPDPVTERAKCDPAFPACLDLLQDIFLQHFLPAFIFIQCHRDLCPFLNQFQLRQCLEKF